MLNESMASEASEIEMSENATQLSHRSNGSGMQPSSDQLSLLGNEQSKVEHVEITQEQVMKANTSRTTFVMMGTYLAGEF